MSAEAACMHGKEPHDRRSVGECFRGPDERMCERCMLCGAVRTYRVIEYAGPTIEYGPWQMEAQGN
jgi:hypothetical protein